MCCVIFHPSIPPNFNLYLCFVLNQLTNNRKEEEFKKHEKFLTFFKNSPLFKRGRVQTEKSGSFKCLNVKKQVQKYSKAATNKKEAISNGEHKSKSSVRLSKYLLKRYQKDTELDSYNKLNQ